MNLQIDMMTLPRMSGDCLSGRLAPPAGAFGDRPAPYVRKGETAKPPRALRRSDLVGSSVTQILPTSKSADGQVQGREPDAIFVDRMLADPMIRLVMLADGVSEHEIRTLYRTRAPMMVHGRGRSNTMELSLQEGAVTAPGPRPGTLRPGIGE
ncbi:hypothetical protein SSE37_02515 [Sagittula stellata E-37]|uniref:Uncharacterized protein n=1 Tax=Sagittula stellata (strain ATCC 700073 / DSM 11524 / E-37) TaxID=388399 RepID=A3K7V2_SAGS3|nr:hypothetical protein SSE37_02515 [Sagittula stellata E-37]